MNYEQASLSHYLSRNNLLFWMDHKFNAIWNHTFSVKEITQEPLDIAQFFKDNCFLHMVETRPQHVQLQPNSSIFMCVLKLRILETSFRPISKNCRNVQILVKRQKMISQTCSLPKPLGHSEDFRSPF